MHLYTYGTLQLAEIMSQIVGRPVQGRAARLSGYARYRVRDRVYPAIVAEPGMLLTGVVYEALAPDEIERLDHYEGPLYERLAVRVEADSDTLDAYTYVLRAEHAAVLSAEPWDLESFEREHLASYLARISVTRRAP